MRGNSIGKMFSITTFGESHGVALGAIVDGVPSGLDVDIEALKREMLKRAPGQHKAHTARKEADEPQILSGVFDGKTLGTPIAVVVYNTNQKSQDYNKLKEQYRPGHADKTTMLKYGIRDHRGGGRSSGRETLARVIGGYFAGLILPDLKVYSYIKQVAHLKLSHQPQIGDEKFELNFPDKKLTQELSNFLIECKKQGDSVGGIVAVQVSGVPTGLGEPCFDKLKADLAKGLTSIGAVLGVSIGGGFEAALKKGSEVSQDASNFGGMEGGITNGDDLYLEIAFKPTSTIGEKAKEGRHDPCILPRAVAVVEAMTKIILADHYLRQRAYSL